MEPVTDSVAAWLRAPTRPLPPLGTKPLLLLDVDGPLNPYPRWPWMKTPEAGAVVTTDPSGDRRSDDEAVVYEQHLVASHGRDDMEFTATVTVRLAAMHRQRLQRLAQTFDLVWCTFWEHAANHSISPILGLGDLHAVSFPTEAIYAVRSSGSWKTPHLVTWLADTLPQPVPWAWVDDEIDDRDAGVVDWCAPEPWRDVPSLLMPVDPHEGLAGSHFTTIEAFGDQARRWMRNPGERSLG